MKYKHIFWDWNGTLLNDAETAYICVNKMLDFRNLPRITFEQYRDYVDVPISLFYERVMDISKETMEGLSIEYNKLWHENLPKEPLAENVAALLEKLRRMGAKQYIFSSSQNKYIEPLLKKYGISEYFDAVLGADDCKVGSKVQRTHNFIIESNISPKKSVFIGDMYHDSEVASAVNSDCILLSCGHQCREALNKAECAVVSNINELSELLGV
ncbi:MAG: HAD family hydrolase [Clostridia bacterium]|nr:HAD family hydrolase [Clostridia bacterium]